MYFDFVANIVNNSKFNFAYFFLFLGLSSILFALSIDRPELNQAPNDSNLGNASLLIEPIIQETKPEPCKYL